jgi:hypothetical protein
MSRHRHTFVESYDGLVGFGFSREVDEKSLIYYLQKFSDDELLQRIVPRMSDSEIDRLFEWLTHLMKKHLSDQEYHDLFLKDPSPPAAGD